MENLDEKFDEIIRQLKASKEQETPFGSSFLASVFSVVISTLVLTSLGFIWNIYTNLNRVETESQKKDTQIETKVSTLEINRKKGLKAIDYNFSVLNKNGDKLYKIYDEDE